jgi:hypothetical protein
LTIARMTRAMLEVFEQIDPTARLCIRRMVIYLYALKNAISPR